MKYKTLLLFCSLQLVACSLFSQVGVDSLYKSQTIGNTLRNQRCGNGLQIEDSLITNGISIFNDNVGIGTSAPRVKLQARGKSLLSTDTLMLQTIGIPLTEYGVTMPFAGARAQGGADSLVTVNGIFDTRAFSGGLVPFVGFIDTAASVELIGLQFSNKSALSLNVEGAGIDVNNSNGITFFPTSDNGDQYRFPRYQPANGKILKSSGSGILYWGNDSTGGGGAADSLAIAEDTLSIIGSNFVILPMPFDQEGDSIYQEDNTASLLFGFENTKQAGTARGFAWGSSCRMGGSVPTVWGYNCKAFGEATSVWGKYCYGSGDYITVAGGYADSAFANQSFIGGGGSNRIVAPYGASSAIAGGYGNYIDNQTSFIGGGEEDTVRGRTAAALGYRNYSPSAAEVTIGAFAEEYSAHSFTPGDPFSAQWFTTDRVFSVGIGTSDTTRANAITVLKNGETTISSLAPGGLVAADASGTLSTIAFATDTFQPGFYADFGTFDSIFSYYAGYAVTGNHVHVWGSVYLESADLPTGASLYAFTPTSCECNDPQMNNGTGVTSTVLGMGTMTIAAVSVPDQIHFEVITGSQTTATFYYSYDYFIVEP